MIYDDDDDEYGILILRSAQNGWSQTQNLYRYLHHSGR